MANPLITVRHSTAGDCVWMWCPGCDDPHMIRVTGSAAWGWDGSREAPTFSPSLLVDYGTVAGSVRRCHSFVRSGVWEFLTDSTHHLAGQSVPMVPVPDYLYREAQADTDPAA